MAKKDSTPTDAAVEVITGTVAEGASASNGALRVVGDFGPELIFAHVGDPYWGQGGRYIVGADGKRVPAPAITESEENNHG